MNERQESDPVIGSRKRVNWDCLQYTPSVAKIVARHEEAREVPNIPFREVLGLLDKQAEGWFANQPGVNSAANCKSSKFWKEFRRLLDKYIDNDTQRDQTRQWRERLINTIQRDFDRLARKIDKVPSQEEAQRVASELFAFCWFGKAPALELLDRLRPILLDWSPRLPTPMNRASMELLLGGFILGRYLEAGKRVEVNRSNAPSRNEKRKQIKAALIERFIAVVRENPTLKRADLFKKLRKSEFDGFAIKLGRMKSDGDSYAKYRPTVKVLPTNCKPFELRLDVLLAEAKRKI